MAIRGPDITKSALIVVDMQNDFVHEEGSLACKSRELPAAEIDMPFLMARYPKLSALWTPSAKLADR